MSNVASELHSQLILPTSIVSKLDLSRVANEIERVDQEIMSAKIRYKSGVLPDVQGMSSDQLNDLLIANKLQINDSKQRTNLLIQLRKLTESVPVVHMTFASAADNETLQLLVGWLRKSVHHQAVVSVGLQPGLIGGVYVRTPNHVYDLSVRSQLAGKRHLLLESLETLSGRG